MHLLRASALVVVLRAQFVDGIDEHREVLRVNIRCDSMTEIKYMSRPFAVACQRIGNALTDNFG